MKTEHACSMTFELVSITLCYSGTFGSTKRVIHIHHNIRGGVKYYKHPMYISYVQISQPGLYYGLQSCYIFEQGWVLSNT